MSTTPTLKRRTMLASGLSTLALPSIVRAAGETTLKFVPQIDLAFLDPHWTTANVTRGHAYMVFDTLYGQDGTFTPSPQMLEGHVVENDGKLWKLTLRSGLLWHDGTPVLARDCVASIRRWAARDAYGGALMAVTDELSAPDDKTIQFRLHKPFPLLPYALSKPTTPSPVMMPERLAKTDPFKQVTEMVGSGPFRYVASERVPGATNVYERFDKYKPREGGKPDWTAGPKVVHFDRVEWTTIVDAATKAAALKSGEQDWWENPTQDLLPLLKADRNIRVVTINPTGNVNMMRPNHLQPPFDKPEVLQALFYAIDQAAFMEAIVGTDPSLYTVPHGFFCPGTPMASTVGLEPLMGPRDYGKTKELLKKAGYSGEKVVMIVATDYAQFKAIGDVAADMMGKVGMNVDYVATDWGTMLQRRNNKGPIDKGGWNCFFTGWEGLDHMNPSNHYAIRGDGDKPSAWPGWCISQKLEDYRNAWFDAPNEAAQKKICVDMQLQCMVDVPSIPLGRFFQPTAYRTSITGVLNGFATFWNVRPA
ncbi:MAG TPA: ABC transporter substrate-binding protein [Rhodopila sp.]|uniref:ABC transporter substrate-binding protein n=1 Tax=Rhodopila sp. TaxID=2480087 RepID=UPI002BE7B48E|nr:ABC transporter substrate-binding protein [Rhodopila sp.]HVY14951.1 ABC transporter substrate-binding protein [Rhodopila sp.]